MSMLRMTRNGQVTIPVSIRKHLSLVEGSHFEVDCTQEGVIQLRPVDIEVRPRKITMDDIVARTEQAVASGDYVDVQLDELETFLHDL